MTSSGDRSSLCFSGAAGLTSGASHCVPMGTPKMLDDLRHLSLLDFELRRSESECFRTLRAILRIKDFPEGTKTKILGLHMVPREM